MPNKPDFTEDYVCSSIDVYFTLLGGCFDDFSVQPISRHEENEEGYDARLKGGFSTFFMQFKRPQQYIRHIIGKTNVSGHFMFPVRAEQHNILRDLFLGGKNVAYVCPCFLVRKHYREILLENIRRMTIIKKYSTIRRLNNKIKPDIPEHICIPPSDDLGSELDGHKYTFEDEFTNAEFHSVTKEVKNCKSLDKWFENIINDKRNIITKENAKEKVLKTVENINKSLKSKSPDETKFKETIELQDKDDGISMWLEFSEYLRKQYRIYQYAFIDGKE